MNKNNKYVLTINSGSSSVKFAVIDINSEINIISGIAEEINNENACIKYKHKDVEEKFELEEQGHVNALNKVIKILEKYDINKDKLIGIGHRVVHGGDKFFKATLIDNNVIKSIKDCINLAPLHNPANLTGISSLQQSFPSVSNVAVFDTAFHQSIPDKAYMYALPYSWYKEHKVRRYGFHGTSHKYVNIKATELLKDKIADKKFISLHLGNGCSAAAVNNMQCLDTTMGLTPLEGLVMGTRSGDLDPGIIPYIKDKIGVSSDEVINILNKKSGLLGLSGVSSDMRVLEEEYNKGNEQAVIALEVFSYRAAKTIASLMVALNGLSGIIFTGGIGENSSFIRSKIIRYLTYLDIGLDKERNKDNGIKNNGIISDKSSQFYVVVIPTNEELMIAKEVQELIGK